MGNACGKRFFLGWEEHYRRKFEEQAVEKKRVENEELAAAERMVRDEEEAAAKADAERKAEEARMLTLISQLFREDPAVQQQVQERMEALTKPLVDEFEKSVSKLEKTVAEVSTSALKLDRDLELHALRVDEMEADRDTLKKVDELAQGTAQLHNQLSNRVVDFIESSREALRVTTENQHRTGRDLQLHKIEIYDEVKKLGELIKERGLELGTLKEVGEEEIGSVRIEVSLLEKTTREVMGEVETMKARIDMLAEEMQYENEEEEEGDDAGEEAGEGAAASAATHKCNSTKCVTNFLSSAAKTVGRKASADGATRKSSAAGASELLREVISDSDSDSDCDNVSIPRKMGKNGVNSIDLIDWSSLRSIAKKPKNSLDKFDEITMRTLNEPPLRNMLEWRRWKETVYLWALALRKVRASFTKMGQMLLNKSFAGHDGEYSMAVSASSTRDLVDIMVHLDTKFSIPVRTIIEKCEEMIPKIVRCDGQSPTMFLQLLNLIFIREAEISNKSPRSEHNKVMRGLSALRLEHNTEQLIKSKLPTEVEDMEFIELENLIDQLGIKDAVRYDATGKKHEPTKVGEKDWISELMVAMGERMRGDASSHSTHMNNYFNTGKQTVGGGIHFSDATGSGNPSGLGPAPGSNFATGGGPIPPTPPGPGVQKDSRVELRAKDQEYWKNLAKVAPQQKEAKLKARMENMLSKKNQPGYWCEFGDWCESVPKTGDCIGRHTGPEFGRLIRKFEDSDPAAYAKWKKVQDEKKKAEAKAKAAAKASAASQG
eukprot:g14378.t1